MFDVTENPFVYGEVVPPAAFVDRVLELDRLVRDLGAGQKVFLISPRRYGKSSLIRRALAIVRRRGVLTVDVTVSSFSSYVAFLEGYARALLAAEARWERARSWLREAIRSATAEVRYTPDATLQSPGSGTVSHVEVSGDGGQTWQPGRFTSGAKPGVWRQWEATVPLRSPGDQRLRARATDTSGNTQPEKAASNPGGYGNNSIHEVTVHAR